MKIRTTIIALAALSATALVALSPTSASASTLTSSSYDDHFDYVCAVKHDSRATCACKRKVWHEILTEEDSRWLTQLSTNKWTAIASLLLGGIKDPAKLKAMSTRMRANADAMEQRCKGDA